MGSLIEPASAYYSTSGGFLFLCFLLSIVLLDPCLSETISETWDVEYLHWSPDCIESMVMGINGKFPGPTITANVGDTLNITVRNKLHTEGVVIHWHGITQKKTPWFDGTASISQCAINAGETFQYLFEVDKAGTYFYHGHYGMQRSAGLYGSLIVKEIDQAKEGFHYNGEFNLLLSDWWHQSAHKQELDLSAKPIRFIGEPQTLLINGRGQYNCSQAPGETDPSKWNNLCEFKDEKTDHQQCKPQFLQVEPKKTYRLRVASTTSLSSINLRIGNHKMKVVEADGHYVKPFVVDDLDIYSGESYSVLFETDQDASYNYWISFSVRGRKPTTPPALTKLIYSGATHQKSLPLPSSFPKWDDYDHSKAFVKQVLAREVNPPNLPKQYERQIILLNTQNHMDGYTKWAINNISLHLTATPYLGSIKYDLKNAFDQQPPPDVYDQSYDIMNPPPNPNTTTGSGVYELIGGKVVDVVLQNAHMLRKDGHSEIHPWHLHGHDFWVLGYGEGKFTKGKDEEKFNLVDPPLKNTVSVFPYGWTALRFVADNPGVWAFHCHIEPHLHMGMGVIFAEDVESIKKMEIPKDAIACGDTAKWLMNLKSP